MLRPPGVENLAAHRKVRFGAEDVIRTPLVVPSFSSKGFPEVVSILKTLDEKITECVLVSAYDCHHHGVPRDIQFPEFIFLDSGGYECSKDSELSDLGYLDHEPKEWSQELLGSELDKWSFPVPTVAISYDHPKERIPLRDQVSRAKDLFHGRPIIKELLVKPETEDQRYIKLDNVIENLEGVRGFDIVGFTEKELGNTLLRRMVNIAKLRLAMLDREIKIPIHIFGSLDTLSTPLYFLSGADIFDGLTWLRFAYQNGHSVYVHDFGALKIGPQARDWDIKPMVWSANYYWLQELERMLKRFLNERQWQVLGIHAEFFRSVFESLRAELEGGG